MGHPEIELSSSDLAAPIFTEGSNSLSFNCGSENMLQMISLQNQEIQKNEW